jgi:beta-glucosidase/6-phospho-beta-glucosidase/beta-galactosidase
LNEKIVADFTSYAEVVFDRFGDRLEYILTLNEPSAHYGRGYGDNYPVGPGLKFDSVIDPDYKTVLWPSGIAVKSKEDRHRNKFICMHWTNLAHGTVVQMSRKKYGSKFRFGMPLIIPFGNANSTKEADIAATERFHTFHSGWNWGPLTEGDYPEIIKNNVLYWNRLIPTYTEEQKAIMKGTLDFLALNYYTSSFVSSKEPFLDPTDPGYEANLLGYVEGPKGPTGQDISSNYENSWQNNYPEGLRGISKWIHEKYKLDVSYKTTEEAINDTD